MSHHKNIFVRLEFLNHVNIAVNDFAWQTKTILKKKETDKEQLKNTNNSCETWKKRHQHQQQQQQLKQYKEKKNNRHQWILDQASQTALGL